MDGNTLGSLQAKFPLHFRDGSVLLIQADCMDVMACLDDGVFCLACCDPPYGIGEHGGADRRGKSKFVKKEWDNKPPKQEYFDSLQRISKNQIIWGGNYFTDKLPVSRCWIAWDKKLYNSDFSDFELAWLSFDMGTKLFIKSKNGGSRTKAALSLLINPCQKPRQLYRWLYKNYAKPEQSIIDTHLGSGSSAIEAHYFGCTFVGVELDPDYFQASVERYKKETAQLSLF